MLKSYEAIYDNGTLSWLNATPSFSRAKVIVVVDEISNGIELEAAKPKTSLLSALKQIKINAPEDFSENLDAYLNGEKNV
jgi:hypothetical protein